MMRKIANFVKKLIKKGRALDYNEWILAFDTLTPKDIKMIANDIEKDNLKAKFVIFILETNEKAEDFQNTINSLKGQLYKRFYVFYGKSKDCLQLIKKKDYFENYFIILPSGAQLTKHALYWMAKEIKIKEPVLIYSDHDHIDEGRREKPCFKPNFSMEYLRSTNYVSFAFAVKGSLLTGIDITEEDVEDSYSLLLKITERLDTLYIEHIPTILFHIPENHSKRKSQLNPVKDHLERMKIKAEVSIIKESYYRVIYHLKTKPLISIIIPTKDNKQVLKKCLQSIFEKTTYKNYEILIVDNQSSEKETVEYLRFLESIDRIRVIRYDKPFNYSAINNLAVNYAKGEVVVFLNNDTEVITP
ncbi:MAG: glycosyltransferase family 2 protein, partial [Aquificaceae bacterium]